MGRPLGWHKVLSSIQVVFISRIVRELQLCGWAGKHLDPTCYWKATADQVEIPMFRGTDAEQLSTWCVVFSYACCSKISLQKGDAVKPGAISSSRATRLGVFLTDAPWCPLDVPISSWWIIVYADNVGSQVQGGSALGMAGLAPAAQDIWFMTYVTGSKLVN